jgi:hypothetical protein
MLLCGDLTVFEGCDYTESRRERGGQWLIVRGVVSRLWFR